MPTLSPQTTPYYGGGQVVNPANVIQVKGTPSTTAVHNGLGTIAVENSAGSAWILASLSGDSALWVGIGGGAGTFTSLQVNGTITATGNLHLSGATSKIQINAGTASTASIGTSAAMVAGTVTVSTTAVTSSSKIFLTANTPGGTQGTLSAPTASIVANTSFVINSSSGSDTSTVNYWIIN